MGHRHLGRKPDGTVDDEINPRLAALNGIRYMTGNPNAGRILPAPADDIIPPDRPTPGTACDRARRAWLADDTLQNG